KLYIWEVAITYMIRDIYHKQDTATDRVYRAVIQVVLTLIVLMMTLSSCSTSSNYTSLSEEERQEIDNQIKALGIEELQNIATDTTSATTINKVVASRRLASKLRRASRFSEAIEQCRFTYEKALEISDTIEMTKALNDLATNFRRIGSLSDATQYHYKALLLADAFSDQTSYTARKNKTIAYNGIGNIDITLKYYDEAKRYFNEALAIETSLGSHLGQAINYANIGSIYSYEEKYDSAFIFYLTSMEHNKLANSVVGISLCHNALGEIYEKREQIDSARMEYQISYDLLRHDSDKWHWLVSCLSLGRVEMLLGNSQKAAQILKEAYDVSIEIDAPEHAEVACTLLAKYERENNNAKRALEYVLQARAFSERVNNENQNASFLNTRVNYEREKGAREIQELTEEKNRRERQHHLAIVIISIIAVLLLTIIFQFFTMLKIQRRRNEELKETNETKDKLFSVISHDLKNPAIAQCNALQMLKQYGASFSEEQLKQMYDDLHKSAVVQVDLLNNLLSWTRLQMGRMQFEPSKIDICGIVTDITELLALQAKAKNITFKKPDDKGLMIWADHNMVSVIVRNIVSNAVKFSYPNNPITFRYVVREEEIMLEIEDYGIGMSEEYQKSIFTEDRIKSTKGTTGEQGSGLGLAVCRDMVKMNKGTIEVNSELGKGTTFRITLPKVK
ncbi:MAG: tetratricopeptide repeat-containing sensor histidine kinase, partial [Bacteroidia bacterium]|nr:tetratricopeptide repeat-containing sensor histidine kinase [Bacteroidia bacterium]